MNDSRPVWPDDYIIFQYLPICHNENAPNSIQNVQIGFNILLNNKWTFKQLSKTFKMLPTWWNFAKSGHTNNKITIYHFA